MSAASCASRRPWQNCCLKHRFDAAADARTAGFASSAEETLPASSLREAGRALRPPFLVLLAPRRRLSVTGQVPARPPRKLRPANHQNIPGPPSAATIFHRRWAHARSRLRLAPPRGTTFVASDIPVPDRSTTSRPIHADRRRPVMSASFDMPSLRATAPIKCRLVAMVHSSLAVDAKTALLALPPFVHLLSKTAPQVSPFIAQPNEFEEQQDNHCPIEISPTTRHDLLLHALR